MSHLYILFTEKGFVKEEGGLTEKVTCKIGVTNNPKVRFDQLQTGMHEPLAAHVWKLNSPETIEKSLHVIFRSNRLHGEWFEIDREDFKAISWLLNVTSLHCNCNACNGFYSLERSQQLKLEGSRKWGA